MSRNVSPTLAGWFAGLALGLCAAVMAEEPAVVSKSSVSKSSLAELEWLVGCWSTVADGAAASERTEECWWTVAGGRMLGMGRSVRGDGSSGFEYLRIESRDDGVVYLASPGGREPTPFRRSSHGERHVTFENPQHDFPQRIHYRLVDDGSLAVRIEADGEDGEASGFGWTYHPASFPR